MFVVSVPKFEDYIHAIMRVLRFASCGYVQPMKEYLFITFSILLWPLSENVSLFSQWKGKTIESL